MREGLGREGDVLVGGVCKAHDTVCGGGGEAGRVGDGDTSTSMRDGVLRNSGSLRVR